VLGAERVWHGFCRGVLAATLRGGGGLAPDGRRSGREGVASGSAVRFDHGAVGQDLARVVEDDDAVAEQAPTLLPTARDDPRGFAVDGVGGWTRVLVLAHRVSPVGGNVMIHNGDERYLNPMENGSSEVTASH
jgi:hypothetical protein